jgi:hypothetical protein
LLCTHGGNNTTNRARSAKLIPRRREAGCHRSSLCRAAYTIRIGVQGVVASVIASANRSRFLPKPAKCWSLCIHGHLVVVPTLAQQLQAQALGVCVDSTQHARALLSYLLTTNSNKIPRKWKHEQDGVGIAFQAMNHGSLTLTQWLACGGSRVKHDMQSYPSHRGCSFRSFPHPYPPTKMSLQSASAQQLQYHWHHHPYHGN